MDKTQLTKRLIGAVVLVALGVIFIPWILTGENGLDDIQGTNIPEKPTPLAELSQRPIPPAPAPPPAPPPSRDLLDSDPTSSASKAPSEVIPPLPPEPSVPASTAQPDSPAAERGWIVQAGSFSQKDNADKLHKQLKKEKLPVFIEAQRHAGVTHYRVRVGPYLHRHEAEAAQRAINKAHKLNAEVLAAP